MYNGIINVYKDKGYTSHDIVAIMRRLLRQKKVGHTGTLDPNAQGVLPVCVGTGTKTAGLLTDSDKEYEAVLLLGKVTDTQDIWGTVLEEVAEPEKIHLTGEEIEEAVHTFEGQVDQIPPMYSAIKIGGKKLYELAREGIEIERKPRRVVFYSIEIKEICLPRIKIHVRCSKGSYIRTLCHDIGQKLGCGACMESLLRTKAGPFGIEESYSLSELENLSETGNLTAAVTSVDRLFEHLPSFTVRERFLNLAGNGHVMTVSMIRSENDPKQSDSGILWRGLSESGQLIGLYTFLRDKEHFKLKQMFLIREEVHDK